MEIAGLIRREYGRVDAYASAAAVVPRLIETSFLVVEEAGSFRGILTPEDLCRAPKHLVVDCLRATPRISIDETLEVVLDTMVRGHFLALPAYRGPSFEGVCVRTDLAQHLAEHRVRLECEVARVASQAVHTGQRLSEEVSVRRKLEGERRLLATAMDQVAEGVAITDALGTVLYANPAYARLAGLQPEEVVGTVVEALAPHGPAAATADALPAGVGPGGEAWKGRVRTRRNDGNWFWEDLLISPLRDRGGSLRNYVVVKRDVTREVEDEVRLRRAQTLESIGTLAGGIAHDFNNILSAVMGYTDLLLVGNHSEEARRKYLGEVLRASEKGRDLVRQILAFSREGDEEPGLVPLAAPVEEAARLLAKGLPSAIETRCEILWRRGLVQGTAADIHRIVMNLGTNAHYAMRGRGGVLSIRLENRVLGAAEARDLGGLEPGPYAVLSVEDTGTGMDESTLRRALEPFFTTKSVGEGTGLGLSVVHGTVKKLGGAVSIESSPGCGTLVRTYLPVRGETTDPETPEGVDPPRGTERLALVDDEPTLALLGKRLLESLGYRVEVYTDGRPALAAILAAPHAVDLVITDHHMPELSGTDLVRGVHAARPGLPVLVCTGLMDADAEREILASGAAGCVAKPVSLPALARAVRGALDRSADH